MCAAQRYAISVIAGKFSEPSVQSADLDNKVFPRSLDDLYGEDYYEGSQNFLQQVCETSQLQLVISVK